MGHTKVRCKKPVTEDGDAFGGGENAGFGEGDNGFGGGDAGFASGGGGGGEDWNQGGAAGGAEWETTAPPVAVGGGGW